MKTKTICVLGLVFLVISQLLFFQGHDFLLAQQPLDFAHWLMLIGAVFCTAFCFVFPKNWIGKIANVMTIIGVVAVIGMCAIDFVFWSYGDNHAGRDQLIGQLINTPVIWIPFMVLGPGLFFGGITTHSWNFIKSNTLAALAALIGSGVIGYGQFSGGNRIIVVIGTVVWASGMIMLLYRKSTQVKNID